MTGSSPLFSGQAAGEGDPSAGATLDYTMLDVFASRPLEGNPLGVFADGRGLQTNEMQAIARELNLSETVFLLPPESGGDVRARIFTPAAELPFAGHPVLGSAFVVADALRTASVAIETGSGVVPVDITYEGMRLVFGRMRQPLPSVTAFDRAGEVLAAAGVTEAALPIEVYENGPRHVLVALRSVEEVVRLAPELSGLEALGAVGVSFFARQQGLNWKLRMFAPGLGVAEDPATGSAAGPVAVHLARHGEIEWGDEIEIHQGAEIARPSVLYARATGSADALQRVEVGGAAVVVARGTFLVRSARR